MAEKDIAEKALENYNDVFADIVNVLLFDGKRRVKEEELTNSDSNMPIRVISYDGAAYRSQLPLKEQKAHPCVTLILYFGYEHPWNGPRRLCECLEIEEELKPYVKDYEINVIEVAWLEDEIVRKFQSDFRIIADFFVQMRKNSNLQWWT